MATYEVTIEVITRLNRKVSANSPEEAVKQAEQMYKDHKQGQHVPGITTTRHQSVEWESHQGWTPLGT